MTPISHIRARAWIQEALTAIGLSDSHANIIATALVQTSLWGIDSHGIERITHYLTRYENGTLNKRPQFKFTKTASSTGSLDADDGHGMIVMDKAVDYALDLARESGVGVIGISNSSHCGAIGLYTRKIASHSMVGFAFTHADALVVPHGGNRAFFGTNPISIAFPTLHPEEPICMDMATSIVPWNCVINARRENKEVPLGIGVDENGLDSTDPHLLRAVKPMGEHKGYALAFLIDMLCSTLNGMNFGPNMTSMYKDLDKKRKLGSLVIALDPMRFGGRDHFKESASSIIEQIRHYGKEVLYPGEPEYKTRDTRLEQGIPFTEAMKADFNHWSRILKIDTIV